MSTRPEVLRRKSFLVLTWFFTVVFGALGLAISSLTTKSDAGPLIGTAACFGTVALSRRIFGSKIILGDQLVVVNPLVTYRFGYRSVAEAAVNKRGALTITVPSSPVSPIYATAFGGSLLDSFFGTTDRAVERVNAKRRRPGPGTASVPEGRSLTRSWTADVFLLLALASAVAAGIVGA